MNALRTLKDLHSAWQAKDFIEARPLLINTCENMIALEDFQKKVLSSPEAALGILNLFRETGLHEAPEGSPINLIYERVKETALQVGPDPGELVN